MAFMYIKSELNFIKIKIKGIKYPFLLGGKYKYQAIVIKIEHITSQFVLGKWSEKLKNKGNKK